MDKWQPIETAPKDRPVLLFAYQQAHEMLACDVPLILTGYWDAIDGSWCGTSSTWTGPFYEPTHWMPFPEPPAP